MSGGGIEGSEGVRGGREYIHLPHELEGYTKVVSEVKVLYHVNDVVLVVTILQ